MDSLEALALSALHSANFMPRRLRQPDRIDNLSTDSFNPHCPSSLPPSPLTPSSFPRVRPNQGQCRGKREGDIMRGEAAGSLKWI